MKDLLNYYYYIITDRINMLNHNYYFTYMNNYFCLYRYDKEIDTIKEIFNLNTYMLYNNYKINKIILNRENSIITYYQNHSYVLILLENYNKRLINLNDIIIFNRRLTNQRNILNRTNWLELWSRKIDNIEYSIKHLRLKYKLIYNSIYYYIGLTENAISYLKSLRIENQNISISHRRVDIDDTITEFYNPLNLIIDYHVRDLAEYLKSGFFKRKLSVENIISYLKRIKMSNIDYIFFYVRMLFPSYFFDLYDLIISGKVKEEKILMITKYQNEYEYLLYEIYILIKSHISIIGLEWINKKFMY